MEPYRNLEKRSRECQVFGSIESLLHWDQQTGLPPAALDYRSRQCSALSAYAHRLWTAPEVGAWLSKAEEENGFAQGSPEAGNLREWRRSYDRAVALPERLVEELARETAFAQEAWIAARKHSDFALFLPHLEKLTALVIEQAELWGYEKNRYDALLEGYEPGARTAPISELFDRLEPELVPLVLRGEEASAGIPDTLPGGPFPIAEQKEFNAMVAAAFGFDFSAGRIDPTAHPFCTTLGPRDIRLTTRYDERDFTSSLLCVLHETGHGLYEQGLDPGWFGTPAGSSVSLGIHESQSRLWENHVGRSRAFWEFWLPQAAEFFPGLRGLPPGQIFRHLNRIRRSHIRVDADEVTYDLHILLRFRTECGLIGGALQPREVPEFWNAEFKKLFGKTVARDSDGCLQDIHWSCGNFGYFPTYTLGNLNAAQLAAAAENALPELGREFGEGKYEGLLGWLREKVHCRGGALQSTDLMREITGSATEIAPYLSYLRSKVEALENA